MNENVKKIELPNTPQAAKALEAFRQAITKKRLDHQKKAAEHASKLKKPTV